MLDEIGQEELFVMTVATLMGVTLIVAGWLSHKSLINTWKIQQQSVEIADYKFYENRFRRRRSVSWLMMLIGAMIMGGVDVIFVLFPVKEFPIFGAAFWSVVLILTAWMVVLALGDMVASATHARAEISRIQGARRELEHQLAEYRRKKSNGEVRHD